MIIIIKILWIYIIERVCEISTAIYCGKKAKYQCKDCKMWSCTFPTKYCGKYKIPPYEDFSNICGKFKRQLTGDKEVQKEQRRKYETEQKTR